MPFREDTDFGVVLVIATTIRTSQWSAGASGSANESTPSARSPRCHSTKPPKIERAAEPEPRRASAESYAASSVQPAARLAASASAANDAAEAARPIQRRTELRLTNADAFRRRIVARSRPRKPDNP